MDLFEEFCNRLPMKEMSEDEIAVAFIWYENKTSPYSSNVYLYQILGLFDKALLKKPIEQNLKERLAKSQDVIMVGYSDVYKLNRFAKERFDKTYGFIWNPELEELPSKINEQARLRSAPELEDSDIEIASRMAEVYMVVHCFENSVRKVITKVLFSKYGENWWEECANSYMKRKHVDRVKKEEINKWLTPRGSNQLFYMDWGDLLTLIRKYENDFLPYVKNIKFVELRFEELESIRNIIAHNGDLPNDDDFKRITISFNDWCRQITI